MAKLDISYQELVDLGFERYDYTDSVFFKQHGHQPFVMGFNLAKNFKMEINEQRNHAMLFKAEKKPYDCNFRSYMQLNSREEIQMTLAVFGFTKQAEKLNGGKEEGNA
jgi:hypothetical protein